MKALALCALFAVSVVALSARENPQETPQIKKRVDPNYPAILKAAGIEGDVFVQVTVNRDGQVEKIDATKATDPRFIPAVMEAVRQWEFGPATKDGLPIKSEVTIPFKFRLGADAYKSKGDALLKLKDDIENILRGGLTGDLKSLIDVEAYVVVGDRYEPLLALLTDKKKSSQLVEGKEMKVEFSRLRTDATDKSGYLVLKTKPAGSGASRFHTIVFVQAGEGQWKIEAWHVSP